MLFLSQFTKGEGMKPINLNQPYLSTRQSAKVLQVSLGTVQKMVELGELTAWKTRGGHRRILTSSLNQQLRRRKVGMQQRAKHHQHIALGIFKRQENLDEMQKAIQGWVISFELIHSLDSLEGLMQAVSHYPDVIYLDSLIPPIEQLHLIHYLSKNIQTRRIPLLVDEAFVQLHPGVLEMANENGVHLRPQTSDTEALTHELNALPEKTNVITYSASADKQPYKQLEKLFIEAVNTVFE
jgi:excisionase family DNA binding protein